MPWWAWVIVGGILAGVELTAVDAAFYLVFLGVAAVLVGVFELAGADLPASGQWLLFAALAVGSMVLFRKKLYTRLRGNLPGFDNSAVGSVVAVAESVPLGGETRVTLRGSQWSAKNVGPVPIAAGDQARVVEARGTMLDIAALEAASQLGEPTPNDDT